MKNLFRQLLFLLALTLSSHAQAGTVLWSSVGPNGGNILSLVDVNGVLYAGTENAILKSSDQGAHWSLSNAGLPNSRVLALGVLGNDIYACLFEKQLYKSSNSGAFWSAVSTNLSASCGSLAASGSTLYAAVLARGLLKSTDGGAAWSATGFTGNPRSVAVLGSVIYASNDLGLFKSTNGGTSWTAITTLNNGWVNQLIVSGNALYAKMIGNDGLFNLFKTTDGGNSWTAVINSFPDDIGYITSLALSGNVFYVGTYVGIFKSTDNGSTWNSMNVGLTKTQVQSLAVFGNSIYAFSSISGAFRSPIGNSISWTRENAIYDPTNYTISGDTLYVGAENGIVFKSIDGSNWTPMGRALSSMVNDVAVLGSVVFAGTSNNSVYKFASGNWVASGSGLPQNANVRYLKVLGNNIYAGLPTVGVFLSTDQGNSWSAFNNGFTSVRIKFLEVVNNALYAGTEDGLFKLNGQNKWIPILGDGDSTALVSKGNALYVGIDGSGVYKSIDGGTVWTPVTSGLGNLNILSLAVSGNTLYAGTADGGVFIGTITDNVAINAGGEAVDSFSKDDLSFIEAYCSSVSCSYAYSVSDAIDRSAVDNPAPEAVYQTERYGKNFFYKINDLIPSGPYKVRLHFAENFFNAADKRRFNVDINGVSALSNFDIFQEAGGKNKALVKEFDATADAGGVIKISFKVVPNKDNAKIDGIEVISKSVSSSDSVCSQSSDCSSGSICNAGVCVLANASEQNCSGSACNNADKKSDGSKEGPFCSLNATQNIEPKNLFSYAALGILAIGLFGMRRGYKKRKNIL